MINYNNLQLIIQDDFGSMMVNIWLVDQKGSELINITWDGEHLISTIVPEGIEPVKPFLKVPLPFKQVFIKSFVDYASNNGIKPKEASFTEGKLEATEKHLEDMREIVKKLVIK